MSRLVFVCWGNICRSPMAERVARRMIDEQGLDIEVESFGLSTEEAGNGIDRRAVAVLAEHGYDPAGHRARTIRAEDLTGDTLFVAVEPFQVERLRRLVPTANVVLLNDLNPAKPQGEPLIDPWYGDKEGFYVTLTDIEAAMPGILEAALRA
ncbi:low molecular weight phosphotyrosine protein phosphatase [Tessaracoccus sp. MC1865]|uniref:low molecular weight protein-tyrosine-phosphatase n=1 Tax=Tessaracoccus sp. MC1865 TaxID=2760310 RepID=UPI0015FEE68E|nr:low molecular weight protein-tyrosine-phosphatase [Tessaracoccus sp. MC1865]MBB1482857.1 low molecular weight phosphotyrosine protein phosphatase [Tessaracoccus sp. MC1865]QTO37705.1 low molecular weight phosphotyrosine protein phosphatase [Tessaracoccus sp. MC1865]